MAGRVVVLVHQYPDDGVQIEVFESAAGAVSFARAIELDYEESDPEQIVEGVPNNWNGERIEVAAGCFLSFDEKGLRP